MVEGAEAHINRIGKPKDLEWFIAEMEYNMLNNRRTADLKIRRDGIEYWFQADYLSDLLKYLKDLKASRDAIRERDYGRDR